MPSDYRCHFKRGGSDKDEKILIHSCAAYPIFFFLVISLKASVVSWVYPFAVLDGFIYVVSEEYVGEIGEQIGKVTRYSDMESYSSNFSNTYKKGTAYYSIEGVDTEPAIAVQIEGGQYLKAVRGFSSNSFSLANSWIGFCGGYSLCSQSDYEAGRNSSSIDWSRPALQKKKAIIRFLGK